MDNVVTFSGLDVGACLPKTVSCDPLCKAREQYSHFPSPSRQHVFFLKKNQPPSSNMSMTYQQQAAMRRRASTSGHMGSDSFRDMGTSNCHIGSLIIGEQVRELPARTSFVEIEPGLFETDIVQTEDRPMLAFTFSQGSLHPSVLGRYVIFRERLFNAFAASSSP